jgi:c-di-GMP-related signal transduction protein
VLSSTFLTRDIDDISNHKPCFITFTQKLIEQNIPASFPKKQVVVELLETIEPNDRVIAVCRSLSQQGYQIALDDFIFDRKLVKLLEYVSIVKIDVRLTPLDTIIKTLNFLKNYDVKLLAEKVETLKEFDRAQKMGFSYFQGYFFSRPEKIKVVELSIAKVNLLRLLNEVTQKKTTLSRLHEIISHDVATSYKLLKFLNSAYFYRLEKVSSIKHAIAYLGEKELRRFILLIIISELAVDAPGELVRLVLVRAKFCELLATNSPYSLKAEQLFILGLFSSLDSMLSASMDKVMEQLPIATEIKNALVSNSGILSLFLQTAIAVERKQRHRAAELLKELSIDAGSVSESYMTAIQYSNGLIYGEN